MNQSAVPRLDQFCKEMRQSGIDKNRIQRIVTDRLHDTGAIDDRARPHLCYELLHLREITEVDVMKGNSGCGGTLLVSESEMNFIGSPLPGLLNNIASQKTT